MTLEQLLPELTGLSRDEKWLVVQALSRDLAGEEIAPEIEPNRTYEIWSPIEANEAAATLLSLLERPDSEHAEP